MPPPEPPAPTPSQPESSSNGQSEPPTSDKERVHLRLRGAAPALMDLHKALGTEPRKSAEPPADQNTIRFAYQAVASHLRPLIRDRCSYHIIDDAAAHELLRTLPPELKPSDGAELRLVDMRLTDGEYELQPYLQRWRDICEEAELWDDKTIISTVLRGGRYQVLGFRSILQTRGQGVDGGCLFRVLWQPEARRLVLNTLAFAVDARCRGQGIGTRMVDVLGLLLKAEAARATRLHGELDDSVMLVDALEPDFYAKRFVRVRVRAVP